jgi:hypothetical protein
MKMDINIYLFIYFLIMDEFHPMICLFNPTSNSLSPWVYILAMMHKTLGFASVPISLVGTSKNIRRQTNAMISQLFSSRSKGMISKTLHLCSYVLWRLKIRNLGWKNNQMALQKIQKMNENWDEITYLWNNNVLSKIIRIIELIKKTPKNELANDVCHWALRTR